MVDEADKVVWIVTEGDEDYAAESKPHGWSDVGVGSGPSPTRGGGKLRQKAVPFTTLKRNMDDFLRTMGELFDQAAAVEWAGMELNEIELSVEINGKGNISIVGIGGEVGSTGAVVLKFRRKTVG